ncbi:unnamed protein product [Linum tenue]|uniref:non-specific serine/threonine protein kinase n=1 Tax=Linum tenue TaxID=586396 RepID=A0AAV0K3I3_9ROSI|nr:unnamed protein product [Linum tenue]
MKFVSFSFLLLCIFQAVSSQPTTDPKEVAALSRIIEFWNLRNKLNITGDPCAQNATWAPETANPRVSCSCDATICHIIHLKVYALDVSGEIPIELFDLKELMDLNLGQNVLGGPIPAEIGQLSKMQYLSFSSNNFNGPLPPQLGNLTSLQQLWASDNQFTGKFPEFIGTFTELRDLRLQGTSLEGPIPSSLRNLDKLDSLILRNSRISGQIPDEIGTFLKLQLLDVSFNPLFGKLPLNFARVGLSMNLVGTSIDSNSLLDSQASGLLQCVRQDSECSNSKPLSSSQTSASGIEYDDESEILGAASLYTSSNNEWAVSNAGNFISNPNGPVYTARTESQIIGTLDSELYKTARVSASSLRYYGLGMENGKYTVELHFAEIEMGDPYSWRGLGRRLFDVYIQGDRVLRDFNVQAEAGGSKRALVKTFEASVNNTVMDVHFFWAGKGTCCIPYQGTYGPQVSAIRVSQASDGFGSGKRDKKRAGKIAWVAVGCAAAAVIMTSVFYLWWTKNSPTHMRIHTDSSRKG